MERSWLPNRSPTNAPDGEEFVSFSVDLPYTVSEATPVRLTIRQTMDKSPFLDLILSSQLITLKP
jgi:hypothetical protein